MENPKDFIEQKIREIKEEVGSGKVVLALSGGVDSSTCAVLGHRAIGEQLIAVFIDDGLMREGEPERVVQTFADLGINVRTLDVKQRFFDTLKGKEDPEERRKAFRGIFYQVLGEVVKEEKANFLLQGTIVADVMETERGVKTQHNVLEQIGIDPKDYGFSVLEPLKELYKNDVREVARELNLPEEIHQRMPFPGPGLATRVLGEVTPDRVEILRKATKIVEEETKELKPFQAFAVLLKDKATGVLDGERKFGDIISVRSVESSDAVTAQVSKIPFEVLEKIQQRITKEIPSVVKVVYDLTPKPPSTIEYI